MEGKIKWFSPVKGFGFIRTSDGNDHFVHRSDTADGEDLAQGTEVEFELGEYRGRPCARNVRPVIKEGVRREPSQQ